MNTRERHGLDEGARRGGSARGVIGVLTENQCGQHSEKETGGLHVEHWLLTWGSKFVQEVVNRGSCLCRRQDLSQAMYVLAPEVKGRSGLSARLSSEVVCRLGVYWRLDLGEELWSRIGDARYPRKAVRPVRNVCTVVK